MTSTSTRASEEAVGTILVICAALAIYLLLPYTMWWQP